MKYLAAYALFALAGKTPSADDIKGLLKTVNAEVNDADLKKVVDALAGKQLHEVISQGLTKVGALSFGGSGAAPAGGAAKGGAKDEKKDDKKAAPAKKEEAPAPKEEEEEVDMGGLFGDF